MYLVSLLSGSRHVVVLGGNFDFMYSSRAFKNMMFKNFNIVARSW